MKRVVEFITVAGAAGLMLLTSAAPAGAVPVTPVVVTGTEAALAITAGNVPPEDLLGLLPDAFDVDGGIGGTTAANASIDFSNGTPPLGTPPVEDVTTGGANASIDTGDFNASTAGARSFVGTGDGGSPVPPPATPARNLTNTSVAIFGTTLSTQGLAPGDTTQVDLTLDLDGVFAFVDPGGDAGVTVPSIDADLNPIVIPDMSGSVSVLMHIADLSNIPVNPVTGQPDLGNLPFEPLFNGSATLESADGVGPPVLSTVGDLAVTDFVQAPGCDPFSCGYSINLSRVFGDVQSLGFGEQFEVGVFVFTNAQILGATGRSLDVDFLNTASVNVAFADPTQVSAPSSLALLGAALVAFAAGARSRRG